MEELERDLPRQAARGDVQYAVARLGNRVLTVTYTGPADLRDKTDVLAAALAK